MPIRNILIGVAGLLFLALLHLNFRDVISEVETSGNSMDPTVPAGSICLVNKSFPYEDIQAGDIVMYSCGGMEPYGRADGWIHRAIEESGESFVMRGDNNDRNDPFSMDENSYVGKVINFQ